MIKTQKEFEMKNKILSLSLVVTILFAAVSGIIPVMSYADTSDYESHIVEEKDVPLKLQYDEEASHGVSAGYDNVDTSFGSGGNMIAAHPNDDWERWSIPLGNGYFGANVFGRTETERIQLTEKTLANPYRITSSSPNTDGLNNFSETYIDFGHKTSVVSNYSRELDLNTAVSTVNYSYGGVTYSREYFTSYPDKAMVIRLDASGTGNLSFTLRPTIPYEQEYMNAAGDRGGKSGTVVSSVTDGVGTIELTGKLEYFDIDFMGLYKVYTNGGTVSATTCTNSDGDTDGTITVSGATSAYIIITMGTDYELISEQFTASTTNKPTFSTDLADTREKVEGYMNTLDSKISGKSFDDAYATLKARHLADYQELFGRVTLDLGFNEADFSLTTDQLLNEYKNGSGSKYLEALYFQYGRYLLIASSRKGALPANLQGAWNRYNHAPWSAGYWHNVNVQMNYWPAFSTNIAETFEAYVDYNKAYMAKAESGSNSIINTYNPSVFGQDGGNGWSIATGGYVSDVNGDTSIGNLGFTTQMFWEYYEYTQDESILREVVYPVLVGAARFITKMVREDADGNYIAIYTDSPEQYVNGSWYYTDKGTAYAQSFAYQNNYNMLLAAKELGIDFSDSTHEDYAVIQRVLEQIDKYDPIRIGLSGQVKEFFEEENYGDMGEYTHRHISQLVGLYPGNVINGTTPAWLDAAEYVLTERGDEATGWGVAHRLNLWARVHNGERAYDLLEQLLKANTATNLWDLHPPFQIDGNLGGTSGISEMLLQSHADYIEPLAAVPSSWTSGSYTGLVARGNFEVSAAWEDNTLASLNIKSLSGGAVSVKYDGIENAIVCDSNGKAVEFTCEDGVITFDTEAGETYIIWNFEKHVKPDAVTDLTETSDILSSSTLTWTASDDAVLYRVYIAKDNEPTYTLIGTTVNTSYVYTPAELENPRITFAVTAVNNEGVESARALAYRNPDDLSSSVEELTASIVNDELQVAIKSNSYAGKYRLYSRKSATAEWVLVQESLYPIIIEKSYDSLLKYGVSVESLYGGESEITPISSYRNAPVSIDYNASNILSGIIFDTTPLANSVIHTTAYGYQTLTDGSFNNSTGRFSTKTADTSLFSATAALPASFILGELRIFDFDAGDTYANNVGSSLKIEVLYDFEWTTVYDCKDTSEILTHRTKNANGTRYLSFDLTGQKAQMIRITAPSPVSGKSISIYEIECSGVLIPNTAQFNDNILLGKEFSLTDQAKKHINSSSGDVSVLTDGTLNVGSTGNTVFYTWTYNAERVPDLEFDATMRFSGEAVLNKLRVYDQYGETNWANAFGPHVIIQARSNGEWITLHDVTITGGSGNNIKEYRKSGTRPNSASGTTEMWLEFDLGLVKADALRIYLPQKTSGNYGAYEIECDGYYEDDGSIYSDNLFEGREFIPTDAAAKVVWAPHTYDRLTDGVSDANHRFSSSGTSSFFDATLGFEEYVATLETLTIDWGTWQQVRSGTGLVVEVFDEGIWNKVIDITHDRAYQGKVTYELNGVSANAIRIYIPGVYPDAEGTLLKGDCIAIMEISCTGTIKPADYSVEIKTDVFTGLTFTPTDATAANNIWSPNTYDKITDDGATNDSNSRFATANGHTADGTLDFGGQTVILNTLTVNFDPYTATRCGQDFSIYVYNDGEWMQVLNHVHTAPTKVETFELGGVKAQKIRFAVSGKYNGGANADGQTGDCVIIYEMACTGTVLTPLEDMVEKETVEDVFTDLEFVPTDATASGNVWATNTYNKITDDGDINDDNSRFASANGHTADGTLDFYGKIAVLNTLKVNLNPYAANLHRCGKDFNFYVYRNGEWKQVLAYVHDTPVKEITFELGGIEAEKVRFTITGKYEGSDCIVIYEMSCTGELIIPETVIEDKGSNILLGTSADQLSLENAQAHSSASVKDLTNAFDGDKTNTRYAVLDAAGPYSLVIDLKDNIPLYTLSIYDWRGSETVTRSDKTKIELYVDDCWIPVIVDQPLTTVGTFTSFDLMGTVASKIRITFNNTNANSRATIYEITCTTGSSSAVDRAPLLEAYKNLADASCESTFAADEIKKLKLEELKHLLMDTSASQSDIDSYSKTVTTAKEELTTGMPTTDAYGDLTTHNLQLSDDIAFNFYGEFSDTVDSLFPDAYVYVEYSDGTVDRELLSELEATADGKLKISLSLAAAEMTDTVKLRVIFDSSNCGEYIESSVRKYSDIILADESQSSETKELICAMLDYGAYAQEYFGYKTDNLANAGIHSDGDDPLAGITHDSSVKLAKFGSATELIADGWSLALEENIKVRFYFRADKIEKYAITYKSSDGSVNYGILTPELMENGSYRLEINIEDASLLDNWYTISITNLQDSTQLDITFSVMCYVEKILSGSTSNEKLVNLAKAIKLYSIKANEYVN